MMVLKIFCFPSDYVHRWILYSEDYFPNANLEPTSSIFRNTFFSYSWILKGEKSSEAQLSTMGVTDSTTSSLIWRLDRRKTKSFCKPAQQGACPTINNVEKGIFFFVSPCKKSENISQLFQKLMSRYTPIHSLDLCYLLSTRSPLISTTVHGEGDRHLPE